MGSDYDPVTGDLKRSRPILRALIVAAFAFIAGLVAMGYLLTHWDIAADFLKRPDTISAPRAAAPPARVVVSSVGVDQAVLGARVAALETRLQQLDARANAASGNASRAEALLIAVAARRALDRGAPLGYMEALLSDRFGRSDPQAVATIISAARQPVTLQDLQAGLTRITPALIGPSHDVDWWEGVRRELSSLVVVRRADMPSPDPVDRLARARDELQADHVDNALAEVARLPNRAAAAEWIAAARRYILARVALNRIESAALLQPRAPEPVAVAPAPEVSSPE